MGNRCRQQGQSISEFAVILGAILLACGGMSLYLTRAVQAKVKVSTDDLFRLTEEDVTGMETQDKGITAAIPNVPLPAGKNPSDYTVTGRTDRTERYAGRSVSIDETATVTSEGEEIYRELVGRSGPDDPDQGRRAIRVEE